MILTCAWCDGAFERPHSRGPVPMYCSASHRQMAFRARRDSDLIGRIARLEADLRSAREAHARITEAATAASDHSEASL